jgi:hypothetical protein
MLVIVSIIGVLVALLLPAGDWDRNHRFPTPRAGSRSHVSRCAAEYYQGDGRGRRWNLALRADGVYSFIASGCTGVHERESGYISEVEGLLTLSPAEPTAKKRTRVFQLVRWGPRVYLIGPEEMETFCQAIAAGEEPRKEVQGAFYLGWDLNLSGDLPRVDGLPELHARWASYLRDRVHIGTIVEVKGDHHLRIDLGAVEGIHVDDLLGVQGCGTRFMPLKLQVNSVDKNSCVTKEIYPGIAGDVLQPGWKVVAARKPDR